MSQPFVQLSPRAWRGQVAGQSVAIERANQPGYVRVYILHPPDNWSFDRVVPDYRAKQWYGYEPQPDSSD